ncbi:MAG TPA: BON domain-containing protein [Usitatibacter sp.]|nr:BON domain-containing protein [Usitatibacter sp.]
MTTHLFRAIAAAVATCTASFAFAQGQPAKIPSDLARLHFVQEPVARALKGGDDDALVSGIVTELNKDSSLQGSKITVSNDDGVVTLTGATMTPDQKARVAQVAVAQAGEGKVIDTVLDSAT